MAKSKWLKIYAIGSISAFAAIGAATGISALVSACATSHYTNLLSKQQK
ncbi:MAG: hypothetical protein LBQ45_01885 [Mycoplasmataceae bacterium]|nr:hypothetical protein [Mycoplasmataceae bacterium]